MKLSVSVYRSGSDCTNSGVTSPKRGFEQFTLYLSMPPLEDIEADVAHGRAPLLLDRREGRFPPVARPLTQEATRKDSIGEPKVIGGMAGGNFIYACGSQFRELVSEQPIAVHDRFESQIAYDANFN